MHIAETMEQAKKDVAYGMEQWFHYFQAVAAFPQMAVPGDDLDEMIAFINESGFGAIGTPVVVGLTQGLQEGSDLAPAVVAALGDVPAADFLQGVAVQAVILAIVLLTGGSSSSTSTEQRPLVDVSASRVATIKIRNDDLERTINSLQKLSACGEELVHVPIVVLAPRVSEHSPKRVVLTKLVPAPF